jgi:pilus assembly protein CpaB
MNLKTMIPLVVALILGVVAAKVGHDMMLKGRQSGATGIKTIKVVVAKEELSPGSTIKDTDLTLRDMPAEGLPPSLATNPAELAGRVLLTQVAKGQVIPEGLLAPKGSLGGLAAMVPAGKRAVTLEVNEVSGVAGMLTPGAHVDVVQTIQAKGEKGQDTGLMAKTIVENLRVIAVGRRLSTPTAAPGTAPDADQGLVRSVTLLATTEQAEAIDLASHVGSPRLVLRNGADDKLTGGRGITVAELRGEGDRETLNLLSHLFLGGGGATTKPVEPANTDIPKPLTKNYRNVEVIRAGASSTVRMGVAPRSETLTGGADKLLGEVPQDR